jgi:hypothetical protein
MINNLLENNVGMFFFTPSAKGRVCISVPFVVGEKSPLAGANNFVAKLLLGRTHGCGYGNESTALPTNH